MRNDRVSPSTRSSFFADVAVLAESVARGRASQQLARIGMCGSREQLVHGCLLDHFAGAHDADAIGVLRDDAEIMRDEDDRQPCFVAQRSR